MANTNLCLDVHILEFDAPRLRPFLHRRHRPWPPELTTSATPGFRIAGTESSFTAARFEEEEEGGGGRHEEELLPCSRPPTSSSMRSPSRASSLPSRLGSPEDGGRERSVRGSPEEGGMGGGGMPRPCRICMRKKGRGATPLARKKGKGVPPPARKKRRGVVVGKEEGEGSDAADEEEAKGPPVRKKRRNAAAGELRRESGGGTTASFREANSTQNRRGRGRYCRRRAVGAVIPVGIVMRFHLSMSTTSKQWN